MIPATASPVTTSTSPASMESGSLPTKSTASNQVRLEATPLGEAGPLKAASKLWPGCVLNGILSYHEPQDPCCRNDLLWIWVAVLDSAEGFQTFFRRSVICQ